MITKIYTDCTLSENEILTQLESNEEVKSILRQLENEEKEYTLILDLSECIDYSAMMWLSRNEEGKYTIVEGTKIFDKENIDGNKNNN